MNFNRWIPFSATVAAVLVVCWKMAAAFQAPATAPAANPTVVSAAPAPTVAPGRTAVPAPSAGDRPSAAATRPAGAGSADPAKAASAAAARTRTIDKQLGGEAESIVQVANLIYAGTKSSKCFSDHFLVKAEKESAISTSRRFHAVKLSSDELFAFPLVIMTGEGSFQLSDAERKNLRAYVDRGGFLLASAGCSSSEWDVSLRGELARVFPECPLQPIGMDHPVFHTVYEINALSAKHGTPRPLEGITVHGHLGVLYSVEGLNDTAHTQGCCCCGGNEITNALDVNVNILAYALVY